MAIRFRILKDGRATISGVNYQDFRSLMTAAALHYYEDLDKIKKKPKSERNEDEAWAKEQLKVLDYIQLAIDAGIAATFPKRPERPLTKKERWKRVREAQAERRIMDDIFKAMMTEVKRRKKKKAHP